MKPIDISKYGLVDGYPEKMGIYTAFMAGWALGKEQSND